LVLTFGEPGVTVIACEEHEMPSVTAVTVTVGLLINMLVRATDPVPTVPPKDTAVGEVPPVTAPSEAAANAGAPSA